MLGSSFGKALGKKGKTEVKSVQLAAAAAKKVRLLSPFAQC